MYLENVEKGPWRTPFPINSRRLLECHLLGDLDSIIAECDTNAEIEVDSLARHYQLQAQGLVVLVQGSISGLKEATHWTGRTQEANDESPSMAHCSVPRQQQWRALDALVYSSGTTRQMKISMRLFKSMRRTLSSYIPHDHDISQVGNH